MSAIGRSHQLWTSYWNGYGLRNFWSIYTFSAKISAGSDVSAHACLKGVWISRNGIWEVWKSGEMQSMSSLVACFVAILFVAIYIHRLWRRPSCSKSIFLQCRGYLCRGGTLTQPTSTPLDRCACRAFGRGRNINSKLQRIQQSDCERMKLLQV